MQAQSELEIALREVESLKAQLAEEQTSFEKYIKRLSETLMDALEEIKDLREENKIFKTLLSNLSPEKLEGSFKKSLLEIESLRDENKSLNEQLAALRQPGKLDYSSIKKLLARKEKAPHEDRL